MTHFRHAAIAAALLAGVGSANAQTTVITREPVETQTVVTTQPLAHHAGAAANHLSHDRARAGASGAAGGRISCR